MNISYYKSRRTIPLWLKWFFVIFMLILVSCIIYGIVLYKTIQHDKTKGYSNTEQEILNETDIVSVDQISHFYGETVYHIVIGKTANDKRKIVFVDKNEETDNIVVFDNEKMMSEENIQSLWMDECSNCELIKINPAMINKEALWEVTYKDDSQRYIIEYLSMHDGSRYEQYRFKPTFN